ncbi:MAG: hypothetical protein AAFR56_01800 [Chloroflexota bacterium]
MVRTLLRFTLSLPVLLTALIISVRSVSGVMHPIDHIPQFLTHPDCSGACWQGLHLGSSEDDVLAVVNDARLPLSGLVIERRGTLASNITVIHTPAPSHTQTVHIEVRDRAVFTLELSQSRICLRDLLLAHGRPRGVIVAPTGEIGTALYSTGIMQAHILRGKTQNAISIRTIPTNYRRHNPRPVRFHWHRLPEANLRQPCP